MAEPVSASRGFTNPVYLAATGMVVIAIMALVSHLQLDKRLRMVGTQFNFTEAAYAARTRLTAATLTPQSPAPRSTGAWIALFNNQVPYAPGGGPAFIVNKQGSSKTGAVGVSATHFGNEVHLTRPAYGILTEYTTVVRVAPVLSANSSATR